MTTMTKPASVAMQLIGTLITWVGLIWMIMDTVSGGVCAAVGVWFLYAGGKAARQRIRREGE